MRKPLLMSLAIAATLAAPPARAGDAVKACEDFFAKFQKCVDGLKGDQQDEARVFMKTLRGTLGMSDGLNRGDPMMLGIMCGGMMEEIKKDSDVQKYNCQW